MSFIRRLIDRKQKRETSEFPVEPETMSVEEEQKAKYIFGLKPDKSVVASHATRSAKSQCAYMMPAFQEMIEKKPTLKLLDVGCGPGSITIDLAKMMPSGQVTGYDLSGAVLETAKVSAEQQNVTNVTFQKGDVYSLPYADGAFDVVHTHQAVAHFHNHIAAIRELLRVTRKGGIICMREGDLHTARFYPDSPLLEECFQVIIDVHRGNGGSSDAGRHLKAWAVQAGIPRERVLATHSAWSYNTPEQRREYGQFWPARCTQGAFAERAVEMGVGRERLEAFAGAWRSWVEDEDGVFCMMHGEVVATK